jgi:hypothetical protein
LSNDHHLYFRAYWQVSKLQTRHFLNGQFGSIYQPAQEWKKVGRMERAFNPRNGGFVPAFISAGWEKRDSFA